MTRPEHPSEVASLNNALSAFVGMRPRLFGIAYRMLGSAADAEDILQNVWLRWQKTDRNTVRDTPAFLVTITTRLAINLAQSAQARRQTYIGPWIPEPVDTRSDPHLGAERGEALEFAVLLLLEKLTPNERAAYVLREAFDYPYEQIAGILRLDVTNVRQLVSRARKHISHQRTASVSASEQKRLLTAFVAAARDGSVSALEALFAPDVASYADGGGVVRAARVPIVGRTRVAKFIAAIASHYWTGVTLEWIEANTQVSILMLRDDTVVGLATIIASPQGIEQILWVMRPSKLAAIARIRPASRASQPPAPAFDISTSS